MPQGEEHGTTESLFRCASCASGSAPADNLKGRTSDPLQREACSPMSRDTRLMQAVFIMGILSAFKTALRCPHFPMCNTSLLTILAFFFRFLRLYPKTTVCPGRGIFGIISYRSTSACRILGNGLCGLWVHSLTSTRKGGLRDRV